MMILLSPAKTLDYESKAPYEQYSELLFGDKVSYLSGKLKSLSGRKLKSLMNISDDLAQLNYQRNQNRTFPFSLSNAKQAIYAFKGDVYIGLGADKFTKEDVNFAQDHIRILSGLYGILRPLDLIQPYRLEMGTNLAVTPKKTNLYKFWNGILTHQINNDLEATKSKFIVNLASQEYAKAIDFKKLAVPVISPEFKEEKGDQFKMISFFAKKARGLMASYLVKNRIRNLENLKGFESEGYNYNERLSNNGEPKWVFTRKTTQ